MHSQDLIFLWEGMIRQQRWRGGYERVYSLTRNFSIFSTEVLHFGTFSYVVEQS